MSRAAEIYLDDGLRWPECPRTLLLTDIIPAPGVVDQRREPSLAGECPVGRALFLDQPQAQTVVDRAGSIGVVIRPFRYPAGLGAAALDESVLQDSDALGERPVRVLV